MMDKNVLNKLARLSLAHTELVSCANLLSSIESLTLEQTLKVKKTIETEYSNIFTTLSPEDQSLILDLGHYPAMTVFDLNKD